MERMWRSPRLEERRVKRLPWQLPPPKQQLSQGDNNPISKMDNFPVLFRICFSFICVVV